VARFLLVSSSSHDWDIVDTGNPHGSITVAVVCRTDNFDSNFAYAKNFVALLNAGLATVAADELPKCVPFGENSKP
jgi:hypothetical protein